jgi:exosortase/archaeosortase
MLYCIPCVVCLCTPRSVPVLQTDTNHVRRIVISSANMTTLVGANTFSFAKGIAMDADGATAVVVSLIVRCLRSGL